MSQPETHELTIAENLIVRFTTVVHSPKPDEYFFSVMPNGDFNPVQDVTSILSSPALFLSPFSLNQTVASSEMSLHRLVDYFEREAFICRVMHSAELLFSSVEVMNHVGDVVSTAHLLRGNVLPAKKQVGEPQFCRTLDEAGGERAMLIRGCKDWSICIGKWKGVVKGVPGVPGIKGSEGSPGVKGTPGVKGQPGDLCIEFFSLSGVQEWKRVRKQGENFRVSLSEREIVNVDLRTGVISFPSAISAVPESIALGFSIAVLHLLCQPNTSTRMTDHTKPSVMASSSQNYKTRRIRCEDLTLVVAAGFYATIVPSNAYIKHELGDACGGCDVEDLEDVEVVEVVEVVEDAVAVVDVVGAGHVVAVVAAGIKACLLTEDELKG